MAPPVAFLFFCSRAAPLAGTRSIPALRFSAFLLPLNLSTPHMRRFACPNSNERDTHRLFGAMEVGFHGLSPALPRRQSFRLIMAGQELAPHLPFLRRYARALTGSQTHGDAFVRATLEAIIASPESFPRDVDPRLGLYRTFHAIWSTANIEEGEEPSSSFGGHEGIAQARLSRVTPLSRQALLLTALEGFSPEDTAYLIGATPKDVESLVAEALEEIARQTLSHVLLLE